MKKILTFILNEYNELLLLKGSPNDPQFHKAFWYVVTGAQENVDNSLEDTVIREVKEERNLDVTKTIFLNQVYHYESLGYDCEEYVYVSYVKSGTITLNEEHTEYRWCNLDEFVELINWDDDKDILRKNLERQIKTLKHSQ